jgi:signal transduction histidine kinase
MAGQESTPLAAHQLTLIKDIAEALNEANDIHAAMAALLPRLANVLGLTTAWAFRFDPTRSCFVEVGASGLPPALADNDAEALKGGWCECQSQFIAGSLDRAVNIVRCSRLRDATGDKQGLAFHASVPLRSKGKPLGILNVAASGVQAFQQEVLELLGLIAHQVAVSVDRAGLLAAERERAEKLQLLSAMSAELVSLPSTTQMLQTALECFVERLGYEACGITQPDAEDGLRLVAASHRHDSEQAAPYRYEDDSDSPGLPEQEQVILSNAKSFLAIRIPQTDYTIRLESHYVSAFNQIDKDIVSAFTWHLCAALEYARLHQQSVASAKWAERRRLAADLHDSVSQRLFSALLLSRSASMLTGTPEQKEKSDELLAKIQSLIAESQEEMRALIRALRPAEERSFVSNLQQRIDSLQLQSGARFHLMHQECATLTLPLHIKDALLKATDEALQNALKHAKAKNVFISLRRDEHHLSLTIADDGMGFDEHRHPQGLGMSTMYERITNAGGTMKLKSIPGSGTTLQFQIPVSVQK